jgi:hypothetical protein
MISTLNLTDKLALNQLLAASIAKEIGTAPVTAGKKSKKDPNAPKRAAAPGVLAWNAFIKHCKTTQPTLFEGIKLEKDRLAICGGIKEKDLPAYQAWVAEFIKNIPAASAPASAPSSDTEDKPAEVKASKPKKSDEQKAAEKQKRKEKADAKKATASSPAAAPAPSAEATEGDMIKKTIKGKHYLMDPESGNLYATDSKHQSVGDYVGKFNADDDANPIDFDAEE